MIWCSRCLMPSTRPRVVFTDGVCNACLFHDTYAKTDWASRKQEFLDVVKAHKRHPVYDCIVPFSGGKDSSAIAWRLKNELGLKPLLVTFGQLLWSDVGRRNWQRVRNAGFDVHYWGTDQSVSRKLARRFLIERGHPKNHYDAAVNAVPLITAVNFGIPLVIFAEHGESFYGGHVLSENHRRERDLAEVLENQVGDDARNWAVDGITEKDLYPYIMPDLIFRWRDEYSGKYESPKAIYFSYFFKWDIYENALLCRDRMNFEQAQNREPGYHGPRGWWGKSDGSFEGFDSIDDKIDDLDYYMMHVKFGFGRAARMASRLIQLGHMDRETGLEMVRRYDGEWPGTYMHDVLEYVGMSRNELLALIDKHRNPEIWKNIGFQESMLGEESIWELRHPPS